MIIIKAGGGKYINWNYIAQDIATLNEQTIIVHGANAAFKEISQKFGLSEKIIQSPSGHTSRYTDNQTMELLTMVYSGLINKKIVSCLQKHGINAVGLSGADGKLWLGKKKDAILAKVGSKTKLITDSGELINVDNDRALAVMARDLKVRTLVILFEAPGFMEKLDDPSSKVSHIDIEDIDKFLEKSEGRMKKKLLGVTEAINAGVTNIYFGDGRIKNPVSQAMKGKGTTIN